MVTCRRPAEDQAQPWRQEGLLRLYLADELLAIDSCWDGESFALGFWPWFVAYATVDGPIPKHVLDLMDY